MALTKEDLVKEIENMSVLELNDLVDFLKEKFDVSGAPMAQAIGGSVDGESGGAEKSSFDVVLKEIGPSKIAVIKEVKSLLGLGLKEAKDLVEKADSPLKQGVEKKEADEIKLKIEAAGATVELK